MKKLLVCLPLVLASCQSVEVDSSIQSALGAICPTIQQTHAAFLIAATSSQKVAKYASKEAQAYAAIEVGCIDPTAVDSHNVLIYIATAYAAWKIAGVE